MFHTTLNKFGRVATCGLVAASIAAPTASGFQDLRNPDQRGFEAQQPGTSPSQDLRSPDARDAAARGQGSPPSQDLRSPDTRDAASGLGHTVEPLSPTAEGSGSGGFDWSTAGITAAIGGALLVVLAGLATARESRKRLVRS